MPKRVQMTRNKPWRADNPDAVAVARPSKWGNPFTVKDAVDIGVRAEDAQAFVVECYDNWLRGDRQNWMGPESDAAAELILSSLSELRGKDLACWCPLDQPCHADVLLRIANEPTAIAEGRT